MYTVKMSALFSSDQAGYFAADSEFLYLFIGEHLLPRHEVVFSGKRELRLQYYAYF
jgi:hypothetical protein